MRGEQIKVIRKGIYRIIIVTQTRVGGYKLAQDFEKRTYDFEKDKWKDAYGNVWEIVEKVT